MKIILFTLFLIGLEYSINAATSQISTISEILVTTDGTKKHILLKSSEGGWTACSNTPYVVFDEEINPAIKEMLSVALTAKTTGVKIKIKGTCNSSSMYLQAEKIYFDPEN